MPKGKEAVLVIVLLAGAFLAVLNQMLTTSALPVIMRDLTIDAALAQWLTSGYMLVYAAVIPTSAYLMNRFSIKRLFIGAYSFLLVGSIVAALSSGFAILLTGRLLQAVCVGVLTPVVMTVVMLSFSLEKRGLAIGLANLVIGIAPALGPLFAGLVADALGWRAMFACVAVLSISVMLVAGFVIPRSSKPQGSKLNATSVALSSLGLAGLLYGFSSFSSNAPLALALSSVGIILLGIFAHRQLRADNPLLDLGILKVFEFRFGALVVMMMQALFMSASSLVPLLVQNGLGGTATQSGLAVLPGALLGAFLNLLAGKLFDTFEVRFPAALGIGLMAAGLGGLAFFGHLGLVWVALAMTGVSCGSVIAFTPLLTWGGRTLSETRNWLTPTPYPIRFVKHHPPLGQRCSYP